MTVAKLCTLLPDSQADMAFLLVSYCRDQCREVQFLSQPTHIASTDIISQELLGVFNNTIIPDMDLEELL